MQADDKSNSTKRFSVDLIFSLKMSLLFHLDTDNFKCVKTPIRILHSAFSLSNHTEAFVSDCEIRMHAKVASFVFAVRISSQLNVINV